MEQRQEKTPHDFVNRHEEFSVWIGGVMESAARNRRSSGSGSRVPAHNRR